MTQIIYVILLSIMLSAAGFGVHVGVEGLIMAGAMGIVALIVYATAESKLLEWMSYLIISAAAAVIVLMIYVHQLF